MAHVEVQFSEAQRQWIVEERLKDHTYADIRERFHRRFVMFLSFFLYLTFLKFETFNRDVSIQVW